MHAKLEKKYHLLRAGIHHALSYLHPLPTYPFCQERPSSSFPSVWKTPSLFAIVSHDISSRKLPWIVRLFPPVPLWQLVPSLVTRAASSSINDRYDCSLDCEILEGRGWTSPSISSASTRVSTPVFTIVVPANWINCVQKKNTQTVTL